MKSSEEIHSLTGNGQRVNSRVAFSAATWSFIRPVDRRHRTSLDSMKEARVRQASAGEGAGNLRQPNWRALDVLEDYSEGR